MADRPTTIATLPPSAITPSPSGDALPTLTAAPPIVQELLQSSRRWRGMYFQTMQDLELQSVRDTGRGRFETWADQNYGDAVRLGPKMMMREPEAAPHGTVEDLLEELDRRAGAARTIEG